MAFPTVGMALSRAIPLFAIALVVLAVLLSRDMPVSRLRALVSRGPPVLTVNGPPLSAVVLFLCVIQGSEEPWTPAMVSLRALPRALADLDRHFSRVTGYRYKALVVHDGWADRDPGLREEIRRSAGRTEVLFERLTIENQTGPQFETVPNDRCSNVNSKAYKNMNRAFIRLIFEQSRVLRAATYWMRLDTDITYSGDVKIDPFQAMEEAQADFGYMECYSSQPCTDNMYPFVDEYIRRAKLTPVDPVFYEFVKQNTTIFYGNVGLGRVSLFTSKPYLDFARAIDQNGGIMRHRWDDQHTYAVAIAMFSSHSRTRPFGFEELPLIHRGIPNKSMRRCEVPY